MTFEKKTNVLESVVAVAHEDLNTIGAEMQDDFDEKGERWQEGERGQEVQGIAEHFSGLDYPEPPDALKSIDVHYTQQTHKRPDRLQRRDNALHALTAVIDTVKALEPNEDNEAFVEAVQSLIDDAESMDPIGR